MFAFGATWVRDPSGNITVQDSTGTMWYQGADGSDSVTDCAGNVIERTDADGTRWVRDGETGTMLYGGRPHLEWTSPDGTTVVYEINGNLFGTTTEGQFQKIRDADWQLVPNEVFLSARYNSLQMQEVWETPNDPRQKDLAFADALNQRTMKYGDLYVDTILDYTRVIGTAKGLLEAATGEEVLSGEKVDSFTRVLGILLPSAAALGKIAEVAGDLVVAVRAVDGRAGAATAAEVAKLARQFQTLTKNVRGLTDLREAVVDRLPNLVEAAPIGALSLTEAVNDAINDLLARGQGAEETSVVFYNEQREDTTAGEDSKVATTDAGAPSSVDGTAHKEVPDANISPLEDEERDIDTCSLVDEEPDAGTPLLTDDELSSSQASLADEEPDANTPSLADEEPDFDDDLVCEEQTPTGES
jgi:hypothetical protein